MGRGGFSVGSSKVMCALRQTTYGVGRGLLVIFSRVPVRPCSTDLCECFTGGFSAVSGCVKGGISVLEITSVKKVANSFCLGAGTLPAGTSGVGDLVLRIVRRYRVGSSSIMLCKYSGKNATTICRKLAGGCGVMTISPVLGSRRCVGGGGSLRLVRKIFPRPGRRLFGGIVSSCLVGCGKGVSCFVISRGSRRCGCVVSVVGPVVACSAITGDVGSGVGDRPSIKPRSVRVVMTVVGVTLSKVGLSGNVCSFIWVV